MEQTPQQTPAAEKAPPKRKGLGLSLNLGGESSGTKERKGKGKGKGLSIAPAVGEDEGMSASITLVASSGPVGGGGKRTASRGKRRGKGGLFAKRGKGLSLGLTLESGDGGEGGEGGAGKGEGFDMERFGGELLDVSQSGLAELKEEDLEFVCELGAGAQGTVDKMVHVPTGTFLARKRIRLDTSSTPDAVKKREELFTEVKTYAQSSCPYVVNSLGCFRHEDIIIIVLEFMDCGSLETVIEKAGPLPEAAIRHIAWQGVNALHYLHHVRHLVHRDLKPANILMSSDGQAKITDFGVSKEVASSMANCETFVGTFTYFSPERIDSSRSVEGYNYASDIYAFGLILIECALGHYPYPPEITEQLFHYMQLVCENDAPIDEWLPENIFSQPFRDFCSACLAVDHTARPTAKSLLSHPFFDGFPEEDEFDFAGWLRELVLFS